MQGRIEISDGSKWIHFIRSQWITYSCVKGSWVIDEDHNEDVRSNSECESIEDDDSKDDDVENSTTLVHSNEPIWKKTTSNYTG